MTLENQCTGTPGYAGEQDNDPPNDTDCATASDRGTIVHASELQVFARLIHAARRAEGRVSRQARPTPRGVRG